MNGIWFAAMVAFLVVAGVAAQMGWQLPEIDTVRRAFRRRRQPTPAPRPAAVVERQ
jgi:hypothetical protein